MKTLLSVLAFLFATAAAADPADVTVIQAGRTTVHHAQTKHAKGGGPEVAVDGSLEVLHADFDDAGNFDYSVRDDKGKRTRLNVDSLPTEIKGGSKLHVHGRRNAADEIDPDTVSVLAEPQALQSLPAVSYVFLLVQFADQTSPPTSQATLQSQINTAASYFAEASFNQLPFSGKATPVLKLSSINKPVTCDAYSWTGAADTAAKAAGFDPATFTGKYYIATVPCGWRGQAYVGLPKIAWANGAAGPQVYTHEIGHNLGLYHAGSVGCVGTACGAVEYGDGFSTMGNQRLGHYDAKQKQTLGWSAIQNYAGGTQQFTIPPIETGPSNVGVKVATARPARTYWLEYRQPIGVDAVFGANGVQLRLGAPFETTNGYDDTQVLQPVAGSWYLPLGVPFVDGLSNVGITVLSQDGNGATVQIEAASTIAPAPIATANAVTVPALQTAAAALAVGQVTDVQVANLRKLTATLGSDAPTTLVNWSFEAPVTPTYRYYPAGTFLGWSFVGNAGVQKTGGGMLAPTAPDGLQSLFLQSAGATATQSAKATGAVYQSVRLNDGTYTVSFQAARRGTQTQPIAVTVDGVVIGTVTPMSNTAWAPFSFPFTVNAGVHVVGFKGTNDAGDNVSFLDTVTIQ